MTIEIDHLPVSSLLTLHGARGVGYVAGFYFSAEEESDSLSVTVVAENPDSEKSFRFTLPTAEIVRAKDENLCTYLTRRIEARGGFLR